MKIIANKIRVEVEDSGGDGPVALLIMGLGMQLIAWPPAFVQALVDAGYRVICYDNRDAGLSQGFDHLATPNLLWQSIRQRIGLPVKAPYALQDMADDALGLLDVLGIAHAHVIGASMGGMIAQRLAIMAPQRVASLVSIMSSSGARGLPGPRRDVAAALVRRPAGRTEAALVEHSLSLVRLISSPAHPHDVQQLTERIVCGMRRAYRPSGVLRQMLAIGADTERAEALSHISCPTLVLHGEADPLVPIDCGLDTARRIQGAQFIAVAGMGHDLPPGVVDLIAGHIIPFLDAAKERS